MPKQRDLVRMTGEEMRNFIGTRKSLQVATLDKDGAPHLTTLWFAMVDGKFVFETYGKSQKVVNLRRDPRIAVLLEDGETYGELRGVSVKGKAEIVEDKEEVKRLAHAVMQRNHPDVAPDQLSQMVEQMAAKRVAVVVHPEKVISWDHRKLAQAAV